MDFKDYIIKAGEIARKAREEGIKVAKEGVKYIEVAEAVENKIIELGAKPAFPCGISVNNIAAHDTPVYNDERILKKGDLVKIDLGAHVEGYVADTARTIEITTSKNQKLIDASENALKAAIKLAKDGTEIWQIGQVIHEEITKLGFSPIRNLSGHGTGQYLVHTPPTIPNYNNQNKTQLKKDQIIAIEPFATPGEGLVIEGKGSTIYAIINVKNTRNFEARKLIKFINENYKTLPFAERWIIKEFGLKARILLKILENENIVKQYGILPEKSKALAVQTEHTILIGHGVVT
jgi:methionyl aminopeptidase